MIVVDNGSEDSTKEIANKLADKDDRIIVIHQNNQGPAGSRDVKDIFQPVMLLVKPRLLMYVWLVVLSLVGAVIYRKILDGIKLLPKLLKG